jgi:hypothetical protein
MDYYERIPASTVEMAESREISYEIGGQLGGAGRCRRVRGPDHSDRGECGRIQCTPEDPIVRLRSLALFGVGYVLGTKAGRERYGQIVAAAQTASKRLEEYSGNLDSFGEKLDGFSSTFYRVRSRLRDYGAG